MTDHDQELLGRLGAALAPPAAEPSMAELMRLRSALSTPALTPSRRLRTWVAAGLAITLVSGTGTAFALSGANLPGPLRSVANAVGLPVDSEQMAAAKSAIAALRHALDGGDVTSVRTAAADLLEALSRLSDSERQAVAAEAGALLIRADQLLSAEDESPTGAPADGVDSGSGDDRLDGHESETTEPSGSDSSGADSLGPSSSDSSESGSSGSGLSDSSGSGSLGSGSSGSSGFGSIGVVAPSTTEIPHD